MAAKGFRKLTIDPEFKSLIRPLRKEEYEQLEANIVADGCREPIIIWNGCIIDGHNRYEICRRLHLPYATLEKSFVSRAQAITWICANQLGRRNISDEARKYLIGKQYEAEKTVISQRNTQGRNQHSPASTAAIPAQLGASSEKPIERRTRTASRIGDANHISHGTVEKYQIYSRAMDVIREKDPAMASRILSGSFKISHENVIALSKLETSEIKRIYKKMNELHNPYIQYSRSRQEFESKPNQETKQAAPAAPSVKDLPSYDPDAELTGLTLTIPSWTSSIARAKEKTNFSAASRNAKARLEMVLQNHMNTCIDMQEAIK